ncbi:protein translocase subunit SecD [Spartinivicinus ruber]|uniref:protein translocase subunit SecD n=1 Tax=Spartinivicinus ruber TaxID=2683272 RepID=UPI0013D6BED2|nr:protein translocase subunit SecD [Spartinivicinus ruber]
MLNKYPIWKYFLIIFIVSIGVIYALPNLYQDDPAIQISHDRSVNPISESTLQQAKERLQKQNIEIKAFEVTSKGGGLLRLTSFEDQLKAKSIIKDWLGDEYIVALNLAATTPDWLRSMGAGPMKLGLDLSGGVHFLLEVDMGKAIATRLKGIHNEVRSELGKQSVRYKVANHSTNTRWVLNFKNEGNRDKAISMIRGKYTDLQVNAGEDGAVYWVSYQFSELKVKDIEDYAIKQNLTSLRNRVNELGVSEPLVQRQGRNRIVVELPGVQDTAEAKKIIGKTANLEFRLEAPLDAKAGQYEIVDRKEGSQAKLEKKIIVTGDQVADARDSFDENGRPQVNITLSGGGGQLMNKSTRTNVGRRMAVIFIEERPYTKEVEQVVDGKTTIVKETRFKEERKVISLATIQSALGTQFRITGLDSVAESKELALLLRAGAFAAPMYFVEERTVGPSLGKENIELGFKSVVVGFILVLLFMLVYYKVFGLFANIALGLNLVLLIAFMSILSATLTLPGIAGIVLTVGMAVDANVLIFSRIKEEMKRGLPLQHAIHEGYDRAFVTILDANITTLLVAIILYGVGTGPVRGFAVTLSIGIVTSIFTAIVVTRGLVNLTHGGRQLKKLWI